MSTAGELRAAQTAGARAIDQVEITVTNLGEQGVESVFGVIYPPQVALAGFGRITERPFASNGMVGARADNRCDAGRRSPRQRRLSGWAFFARHRSSASGAGKAVRRWRMEDKHRGWKIDDGGSND